MKKKLEVLDLKIKEQIKVKMAKPNKTIEQHTLELLNVLENLKALGYIEEDRIYRLVEKACIYHDLGKVNKEFQNRVTSAKKKKFNDEVEVVHNILSLYFVDKDKFENESDYYKVAVSVLNHHNYCDNFEELTIKSEQSKALLEEFEIYKIKKSLKSKLSKIVEDIDSIKIKGYLHKCDYSASAEEVAEYPNRYLIDSLDNLLNKWKSKNSDSEWNELQRFCIDNREENIIAIAQTGMGKTEAGLLWIGDNKGFFVLPIRTAINAIYDRVRREIIEDENVEKRVAILHSSSLEYYIKNLELTKNENEENELLEYHKLGKQLAIPLNISTMDQIFDFVYKYQGYELKLTTLSYSKIVIDEIQAYGPDLLAYLIYGVERVVELGGKIAILTATLPPFIKDILKSNIEFKENKDNFTNELMRHNLKVVEERINSNDIYEMFKKNKDKNKNNKILVVCNTIKEAQRLYEELKELINKEELKILHSKFIRMERLEKEKEIIKFGETYNDDKNIDKQNGIWISTSIVEASLDIDFDYLFTELQELNSLFQRLGRCNRKGKKDSTEYNCYIYTEIDNKTLTNGNKGFIDNRLYTLSREAISNVDGQISEDMKIELINEYLTTENLKGSDYMINYKKIYREIKEILPYKYDVNSIDLRNIESTDIIPSPIFEKHGERINEISNSLCNEQLSKFQRIELKDELMKYTVSVYPMEVKNYERALKLGNAVSYPKVYMSNFKNDFIRVIECIYDEAGYRKMNSKEVKRKSNIL